MGSASQPEPNLRQLTAGNRQLRVIRSQRRTLALEVTPEQQVLVRAPRHCATAHILRFAAEHENWIALQLERQRRRAAAHPEPDEDARLALIARAKAELPRQVADYSARMGLFPAAVTITGAKKRFGSCSGSNRICFSWRLMQYPPEAIEYVVVHELAHIAEKNHGPGFYALVAAQLPDYRARQALLRE